MKLELKSGLEDTIIYNPFENCQQLGKFIDKGLYPHLYKRFPDLFDVIEDKIEELNDILISNTKSGSSRNTKGKK